MKKALPRFVTGILIVPFTWFIVSGILSISNLLTASVLRLPADILSSGIVSASDAKDKSEPKFEMPQKCTLSFDKLRQGKTASGSTASTSQAKPSEVSGKFFKCSEETNTVLFKDFLASDKGTYGILNLYAYDVFKVQKIKEIDGVNLKSMGNIADLVITIGLWGIFLIVYALLMLTLCFALLTRAFYLWVIAIFSPLFGLFYFLEGKGKFAEQMKDFSFTSFISLALVPVYVSAALAFGLLFIKKAENAPISPENSSFFSAGTKDENVKEGDATFVMGPQGKETTIEVKGFPIGQSVKDAAANAKDGSQ